MVKTLKYARSGLAIGALIKSLSNYNAQLQRMHQTEGATFHWDEFLLEAGKGAFLGGLIGAGIGAIKDYLNSLEVPQNTDALLFNILLKAKLNTKNRDYIELRHKSEAIIQLIKQRFGGQLKNEPLFMGSTERGTALSRKFDIDIGLLFFPNSFQSTGAMYNAVYDYTRSLIGKYGIVGGEDSKKICGHNLQC